MRLSDMDDERIKGACLTILGVELAGLAVLVGAVAARHMAVAANLCGPASGHCALCPTAAAILVVAVGVAGVGVAMLRRCAPLRPIASTA